MGERAHNGREERVGGGAGWGAVGRKGRRDKGGGGGVLTSQNHEATVWIYGEGSRFLCRLHDTQVNGRERRLACGTLILLRH